ncbi:hypothetical protein AKO1_010474, partial [Acrasis kona]
FYNYLFFQVTERREQFLNQCNVAVLVYISALGYALYTTYTDESKKVLSFIGVCAACASLLMIGSPLIQLRQVIVKKNSDSIPATLAAAATASSLTWWMYGIIEHDSNIYVPNFIGAVLGILQLALKLIFRGRRPQVFSLLPTSSNSSAE